MPRKARGKSSTGVYHTIVRGVGQKDIFHDKEDRKRYLEILKNVKHTTPYTLLGYCLMTNHVHLLIKEGQDAIGKVMGSIGISYAYWYNKKYQRVGHLFQDRYKSENVEDERYLLTVLRYIHQNPVQANMVKAIGDYPWSSYRAYIDNNKKTYPEPLVDPKIVMDIFKSNNKDAIRQFREFTETVNEDRCLDEDGIKRVIDKEAQEHLLALLKGLSSEDLRNMKKSQRNELLREMKAVEGISIRQIERLIGIGRNIIANA